MTTTAVQCLPDKNLITQLGIEGEARTNGELLKQLVAMKFERDLDNRAKQLLIKQIEDCADY